MKTFFSNFLDSNNHTVENSFERLDRILLIKNLPNFFIFHFDLFSLSFFFFFFLLKGCPHNVTVTRNEGPGIAIGPTEFLRRPVITGVHASDDFSSGPLTLNGYYLGQNDVNPMMTVMMIGKKKCLNIKRTLLTGASSGTHPHEGKLECMLEKGPLKGSDGLDVRLYANGVSNADQEKGINAELKMNVEIPDPIVRFVSPPEIARTTSKITGESVASMLLESNVEINGKPCLGILKINPTTLTCIAPEASSDQKLDWQSPCHQQKDQRTGKTKFLLVELDLVLTVKLFLHL